MAIRDLIHLVDDVVMYGLSLGRECVGSRMWIGGVAMCLCHCFGTTYN